MSEASRLIRDSIAALPDWLRVPWVRGDVEYGAIVGPGGFVLFRPDVSRDRKTNEDATAYVALLASPHVAAAVADLLDAVDEMGRFNLPLGESAASVDAARAALEAAITRAGRS